MPLQLPMLSWQKRVSDPRRLKAMQIRTQVESAIREFFVSRGFLETHTPLLVPCPGMEPHIRPFRVIPHAKHTEQTQIFLPTSPEFAMKRLLVGGLKKIFQICPAFRDEPRSDTHRSEFTILEWYQVNAHDEDIMKEVEELFLFIAQKLFKKPIIPFLNQDISVTPPWPRLKIRDLFLNEAGIDLVRCDTNISLAKECQRLGLTSEISKNWDDLFFKIWLNCIEPKLPHHQAVFVTHYPPSQAALSLIEEDLDGTKWAKRFEIYAGGLELGNAFEELTDPIEQRERFEKDMLLREKTYGDEFPHIPIDEEFLAALKEGMPSAAGIAIGVDRMVMLFANEPVLDYTVWL